MAHTRDVDDLVEKVSAKGLREHGDEFKNIQTESEMCAHIVATLHSQETKGFCRETGAEVYYNEQSHTVIILDPNNKLDGGTCYRWDGDGTSFDKHIEEEHENQNNIPAVHKSNAFQQLHPDYVRTKSQTQESQQFPQFDAQARREKAIAEAKHEAERIRTGEEDEHGRRR